MKLFFSALIKYILGIVIVGALIFLPSGTINFKDGWIFMTALFLPIFILGIFLLIKAPDLLKNRLDGKEKEKTQKGVVGLSALMFLCGFIIAGFDFRFGWSFIPNWIKIIALCVFLLSYLMYAEVMRENAYLSRTIKVEQDQKVIDTGLYSVVRHPMYLATILMFLCIPVILDSLWAFAIFLVYPILIICRIINEEKILESNLNGYADYKEKVKFRIIPFIW